MHFTLHDSGDWQDSAAIDPAALLDLAASGHMPAWPLTGDEWLLPPGDSDG